MKNNYLLQNVFSDWLTQGIFTALQNFEVPWKDENIALSLDAEYFGNVSGNKTVSPLIMKLLSKDESDILSTSRINQLASILFNLNSLNWEKEYLTFSLEYNPISNYDMTESCTDATTRNNTRTNTGTQSTTHTGTQTDAENETVTNASSGSNTSGVFGFNSTTAVNSDTSSATANNTTGTQGTNTRTDNLTDARTDNLTEAQSGTESISHTLSRSGNIGVTTSQQMIESERDLWLWNFFYKVVFPSVDKVLTIATYSRTYTPAFVSSGRGGGGSTGQILEKLDEIQLNINQLRVSTLSEISDTNLNINQLRVSTLAGVSSVNLNINQLRASTFEAIDGVTTREY